MVRRRLLKALTSVAAVATVTLATAGLADRALAGSSRAAEPAPKVLMVVSSHGVEAGKVRPGYDFNEFAMAWSVFRDNGLQVDVASPKGGPVESDPYRKDALWVQRAAGDQEIMGKLQQTLATSEAPAKDYDAVVLIGGKGPMFDLPSDRGLQSLLATAYARQAVIAAVCHGPAGLLNVKLLDGRPLLQGRRVTAISNAEDRVFAQKWLSEFPFMLEDELRRQGAVYEAAPILMAKVVTDGQLITGQNPLSAPLVAEAVIRALGRQPVPREPYAEERTMQLIERHLNGDVAGVRDALSREPKLYKLELVGFYGHMKMEGAKDKAELQAALDLMRTGALHVQHPRLQASIAKAEQMLEQSFAR